MTILKSTFPILLLTAAVAATGQTDIHGAWQHDFKTAEAALTDILLFSGDYFSWTEYETGSGAFRFTKGGSWKMADDHLMLTYEFNTADTAMVGRTVSFKTMMKKEMLHLAGDGEPIIWNNIEKGAPTDLTGAWLMAGRERNGEESRRNTDGPRKTMKILTKSRFQWIAYNTETKQFFGSGGGTYSAKDGTYTENIQFFSRNIERVGVSLAFEYRIQDGDWRHIGNSSAGEPMHEIWARRK